MPIGTLIKVGRCWRAIDLPVDSTEGQAQTVAGGFFFASARSATAPTTGTDEPETWQPWIARLEEVDKKLIKATTPAEQAQLNSQRADIIEKLIENLPADQRETWIRQFADTVSAAIQSGRYDGGIERLEAFYKQLVRENDNAALHAYVKFRYISADYGRKLAASMNDPKADIPEAAGEVARRPVELRPRLPDKRPTPPRRCCNSPSPKNSPAKIREAERWYRRIVAEFPKDPRAAKADRRADAPRLGRQSDHPPRPRASPARTSISPASRARPCSFTIGRRGASRAKTISKPSRPCKKSTRPRVSRSSASRSITTRAASRSI